MRVSKTDILRNIGIENIGSKKIVDESQIPPSLVSFKSSQSTRQMIQSVDLDIGFESLGSIKEYENSKRHFNEFDIEISDWSLQISENTIVTGTKVYEGLNLIAEHCEGHGQAVTVYGFEAVNGSGEKEEDYCFFILALRFEIETEKLNGRVKLFAGSLQFEDMSREEHFIITAWEKDVLDRTVTFSCKNVRTKETHDFKVIKKGAKSNGIKGWKFV